MDPRNPHGHASIVDQISNFKIVGPIEDYIDTFKQTPDVSVCDVGNDRLELGNRVNRGKMRRSRVGFRCMILCVMQRIECLPGQVI